ncbi:hypothetical protein [Luteimonas sp. SDU82]|uniref:sulfotransferase family protein n=1 Tax=Luteimonas sp. SDU82 TaxID=3422592 RepID=UPI003EB8F5AF
MSKSSNKPRRTALLVLGMHRSGTSALSGVLAKLGAESPKTLMPPTADNPKGYWESSAIMDFNNAVLASAGSRWDEWEAFNRGWLGSATGMAMVSGISALLADEFGQAPLFLLKDPRICRILPVWLQGLAEADVAIKIVVPVRNPLEVADSLATRNKLTRLQALLIWLRHVLDAEYDSRGQDRAFMRYADLLTNWRAETARIGEALDLRWPRMSGSAEAEIDAYLDRSLKHHAAEQALPDGNAILGWVAEAHAAYSALAEGRDRTAAESKLDQVRTAFDAASRAFAPLFHEVRGDLTQRLDARSADVGRLSAEAKEMRAEIAGLKRQHLADEDEVVKLRSELDTLRAELATRVATMRNLETQHRSDLDALASATTELSSVGKELLSARNKLESSNNELASVSEELASTKNELASVRKQFAEVSSEIIAVKTELAAADARARDAIVDRTGLEDTHKAQLAALNDRFRELEDRKAKAEGLATERLSEIVSLSKRVLELEGALEKSRTAHNVQMAELDAAKQGAAEQEVRVRGLVAELSAQSAVISSYRQALESVRSSGRWAFPGELRELARRAVDVGEVERPEGELEAILRRSKLFDSGWYMAKYQDVRKRQVDPVRHFLRHGAKEGRDPGPAFSTKGYIAHNPDVEAAGVNPLVHYLVYGRKEGRVIATAESKSGGKV